MTVRFDIGAGSQVYAVYSSAGTYIGALKRTGDTWEYLAYEARLTFHDLIDIARQLNRLNSKFRIEDIKARQAEIAGIEIEDTPIEDTWTNEPCD